MNYPGSTNRLMEANLLEIQNCILSGMADINYLNTVRNSWIHKTLFREDGLLRYDDLSTYDAVWYALYVRILDDATSKEL